MYTQLVDALRCMCTRFQSYSTIKPPSAIRLPSTLGQWSPYLSLPTSRKSFSRQPEPRDVPIDRRCCRETKREDSLFIHLKIVMERMDVPFDDIDPERYKLFMQDVRTSRPSQEQGTDHISITEQDKEAETQLLNTL